MDGFSYTNIFDTKGIEYLIIIAFLLLIIPVWILMNRPLKLKVRIRESIGALSGHILRIPQGLFFSRYHTWAFLEPSGMARMGADDLLMHITGDVQLKMMCAKGEQISKGEVIARFLQDGKELSLISPLSGKVTGINGAIMKDSRLMSDDPYDKGWIYRIQPEKWHEETRSCYLAEDAKTWMINELARFREFVLDTASGFTQASQTHPVLQEGGELADHPLADMPVEAWHEFQQRFLE